MSRWTIDKPSALDFDGVVMLKATLVAGSVSILANDERPSVHISDVTGRPLLVSHDAGMLTISHEVLEGMLGWLRHERTSAIVTVTIPRECPVQLNLVSADAVITGLSARTSVRTGSGDVTLDGVTGRIDASTVSGIIETQGLDGSVSFNSVSGDLALAGGSLDRLTAKSVSGKIAADIDLSQGGQIQVSTVSGEVALRLPASTSAEVELNSAVGRVESAFAGLRPSDRPVTRSLTGTLRDGSGRLTVNTVSGSVTLLSRPDDSAPLAGAPDVED
jgi:Toastrack DUF4097